MDFVVVVGVVSFLSGVIIGFLCSVFFGSRDLIKSESHKHEEFGGRT